jgi:hypothetical protein
MDILKNSLINKKFPYCFLDYIGAVCSSDILMAELQNNHRIGLCMCVNII